MAKGSVIKKHTIMSVLGILLTIVCAGAAIMWETVGREAYLYKDVLVVTKDIKKGEVISADALGYIKIEEAKIINNPVNDPAMIIGKAAKQYIPKNAQLTLEYFGDANLVLRDDQFIFKVPAEWIVAVPSSIRRQDEVIFCEINKDYISDKNSSPDSEISSQNNISYTKHNLKSEEWLSEFKIEDLQTKTDGYVKEPLFTTVVAYVKDNSNREIVTVSEKDRYDGSSQLSSIEVVITLKELRAMELSLEKGNKFIVLSKEN